MTLAQLIAKPITMDILLSAIADSNVHDYSLAFMAIDKVDSEHLQTDAEQVMKAMFARTLPHQLIALYIMRCVAVYHDAPYILDKLMKIELLDSSAIVLKRVLTSREFDKPYTISREWITLIVNSVAFSCKNYVIPIIMFVNKLTMPFPSRSTLENRNYSMIRGMIPTLVDAFITRAIFEDINDTYAIMVALCELVERLVPEDHLTKSILCAMANKLHTSTHVTVVSTSTSTSTNAERAREGEPPCKKRTGAL
jgi:hypothetical protein